MNISIIKAKSLNEVLDILAEHKSYAPLAGATDIWPHMRHGRFKASGLVDIAELGLDSLNVNEKGELRLGAAVTAQKIVQHAERELRGYGLLVQAAGTVGSAQIRSRATIGGNICTASPSGDMICALVALGAQLSISRSDGVRKVPISKFLRGPGKVALKRGELLTEIIIPPLPAHSYQRFLKVGKRNAMIIATASLSLFAELKGGALREIAIAWGAVAPTVVRSTQVEALLSGNTLNEALISKGIQAVKDDISPIDDHRASAAYRMAVCKDLLRNCLQELHDEKAH